MLSKKDRSNLAGEFYTLAELCRSQKLDRTSWIWAGEFYTLAELYRRGYNVFKSLGKSEQIDIVVKDGDESLSIEVKSRMSSGQFLCSSPSSPRVRKIWVFVDMNKKSIDEPPDYYVLSAADLYKIGKNREKEIKIKEQARGKKFSEFSSLDITLRDLKKYNQGWDLVKNIFDQK